MRGGPCSARPRNPRNPDAVPAGRPPPRAQRRGSDLPHPRYVLELEAPPDEAPDAVREEAAQAIAPRLRADVPVRPRGCPRSAGRRVGPPRTTPARTRRTPALRRRPDCRPRAAARPLISVRRTGVAPPCWAARRRPRAAPFGAGERRRAYDLPSSPARPHTLVFGPRIQPGVREGRTTCPEPRRRSVISTPIAFTSRPSACAILLAGQARRRPGQPGCVRHRQELRDEGRRREDRHAHLGGRPSSVPQGVYVKRDFRWYEVLSRRMLDAVVCASPPRSNTTPSTSSSSRPYRSGACRSGDRRGDARPHLRASACRSPWASPERGRWPNSSPTRPSRSGRRPCSTATPNVRCWPAPR